MSRRSSEWPSDCSVSRILSMSEVTVSSGYRIVIPKKAREALRLKPGDMVLVAVRMGRVFILKRPDSYHAAIRGLARSLCPPRYLRKERRSWD